jgi:hypothetical protein
MWDHIVQRNYDKNIPSGMPSFRNMPKLEKKKKFNLKTNFLNEVFKRLTTWLPSISRQMYPENVANTIATMGLNGHNLYIFTSCKISMLLWVFLQFNDHNLYIVYLSKSSCFELYFCTLNS